jgi:putative transposase
MQTGAAEVRMVVAVELRGVYKRAIWNGPRDQVMGMRVIACDALLAFCLMSTHAHLVFEVADMAEAERIVRRIVRRLNSTAEERGVARIDTPHLQVLEDDYAVLRYTAYAHANPVKAEMVDDPLAWPFSSHRDVYGLRRTRWFAPDRLLSKMSEAVDARWLHRKAEGWRKVPFLDTPEKRKHPTEGLPLIGRAVASVFGLTEEEMLARPKARRCFAMAALTEGWKPSAIADMLRWTPRHAQRVGLGDTPEVRSVLAVLRDDRLRPTGTAWWEVPAEARGPNLWKAWRESRHR